MAAVVEAYLREKRVTRAFAQSTARTSGHVLRRFATYCPDDFTKTSRRHVLRWLEDQQHCSTSTISARLGIVKAFTRWCATTGRLHKDPCLDIDTPARPRRQPRALDPADVELLLSAAPDARTRLAVSLMVCEGLRLHEVRGLQVGDIDWRQRTVTVIGKGDKQRTVHLTPRTSSAAHAYLAKHPATVGPLIRSEDGTHAISCGHLGRIVTGHMRDCGVKGWNGDGRSPHALRHTYASDLVEQGADIRAVAELMGHQSIQTTMIYQRHVDLAATRGVVEARPYAGGATPPPAVDCA